MNLGAAALGLAFCNVGSFVRLALCGTIEEIRLSSAALECSVDLVEAMGLPGHFGAEEHPALGRGAPGPRPSSLPLMA